MDERAPTLLVIEDAEDQAILVGAIARNAHPGLEVYVAGDGRHGIDFLSRISPLQDPPTNPAPDLVILDLDMPRVDGFGVLEWIREQLPSAAFPVVVLAGSVTAEREKRARSLGAVDVFQKPPELDVLGNTVHDIVVRWIKPGDMIAAHMRLAF